MNRYSIRIELLGDMCVSDGSSYNSLIDTDICKDRYGFPYIPAKRLRGCIRECGLELKDWGEPISLEKLFGEKGDHSNGAGVRIGNAYLDQYSEMKDFVVGNSGNALTHPGNVLSAFSYVRTQTSINYDTGVADDRSLRTMRVANKGLVFIAEAEMEPELFCDFEKCCKVMRHMGISRTRGLGEVRVSVSENPKETSKCRHGELVPGATEMMYEIELVEPIICKSVNGGESNTQDYIEGTKILGLISQGLKMQGEEYLDFTKKGPLKSLNAYVAHNGKRYTEIPGYIYRIKNDDNRYVNKLCETSENRFETEELQLNQMKHGYGSMENGILFRKDVVTERRYHHRRPDDKSIGRAEAKHDDADFYQMDSISEAQLFVGKIMGSEEQISRIYAILTTDETFYLGYSKSSEYGKVKIRVIETNKSPESKRGKAKQILVNLNSPAIVYDENAMATTAPDRLIDEVCASLGIKENPIVADKYVRNTMLGGFNVTWNKRKPTIQAFDKGSAISLVFDKEVEISLDSTIMIGERTSEGYGEAFITLFDPENSIYVGEIYSEKETVDGKTVDASSDFANMLVQPLLETFVRKKAADDANELLKRENNSKRDRIYKPTVSNMILMMQECESLDSIEASVEDRYGKKSGIKEDKAEAARKILGAAKRAENIVEEFSKGAGIAGLKSDIEEHQMNYLREYLIQIKYYLRGGSRDDQ